MKNCFLSIVEDRDSDGKNLLIRARRARDLNRLGFLEDEILVTPDRDYKYRVSVPREIAENVIGGVVRDINYPNFKQRVHDMQLLNAYHKVYDALRIEGLRHEGDYYF